MGHGVWATAYGLCAMGRVFYNMGDGLWIAGRSRKANEVSREARPDSRSHRAESLDPSAERREPRAHSPSADCACVCVCVCVRICVCGVSVGRLAGCAIGWRVGVCVSRLADAHHMPLD